MAVACLLLSPSHRPSLPPSLPSFLPPSLPPDFYQQALAGASTDKALYSNRCLCRLKLVEARGRKGGREGEREKEEEEASERRRMLTMALEDAEKALQVRRAGSRTR